MTSLTTTPQAALAPTTPSVELSQQGLNLNKVVVPTAQILEGLQGAAGKDGSKRVVPFEELQAAAHKLGYGVTEADAKKHGLVDGSKPTTLGKFVEVTKQVDVNSKGKSVLNYLLHPQDSADAAISRANSVRAEFKEAGIEIAQKLAQAPGKNYDPNPVTSIVGVGVETGTRVGSAFVAGGLGLASALVHPVDSVTSVAKALWSPIDTTGKLVDWYQKTPAAEVGEGVLSVLAGAKAAAPVNAVIGSAVKKVAAVPPITTSSTLSTFAKQVIAINGANATLAVGKTVSAVEAAATAIKDFAAAAKIKKLVAKTGKLTDETLGVDTKLQSIGEKTKEPSPNAQKTSTDLQDNEVFSRPPVSILERKDTINWRNAFFKEMDDYAKDPDSLNFNFKNSNFNFESSRNLPLKDHAKKPELKIVKPGDTKTTDPSPRMQETSNNPKGTNLQDISSLGAKDINWETFLKELKGLAKKPELKIVKPDDKP